MSRTLERLRKAKEAKEKAEAAKKSETTTTKKDTTKKDTTKKDTTKKDTPKKETAKEETPAKVEKKESNPKPSTKKTTEETTQEKPKAPRGSGMNKHYFRTQYLDTPKKEIKKQIGDTGYYISNHGKVYSVRGKKEKQLVVLIMGGKPKVDMRVNKQKQRTPIVDLLNEYHTKKSAVEFEKLNKEYVDSFKK